jgi:hypothetical protein
VGLRQGRRLGDTPDTAGDADVGLDAKWEIRPGVVADATIHTDFAQVEADDEQVNLTRFELFFPEKRELFLENAGIFDFGWRGFDETPPFLLFYSRRIGIARDDQSPIPVRGGVRLSGSAGRQTVGFLDMLTGPTARQASATYGVRLATFSASTRVAHGAHLLLRMGFNHHRVELLGGSFTADVAVLRAVYGFSRRLAATGLLQRNSLEGRIVTNVRLDFMHHPGSDLFVVFNEERHDGVPRRLVTSRGLAVKLTYLTRF